MLPIPTSYLDDRRQPDFDAWLAQAQTPPIRLALSPDMLAIGLWMVGTVAFAGGLRWLVQAA